MKRAKLLNLMIGLLVLMNCMIVNAEPAMSIDDIGTQVVAEESGGSSAGSSSSKSEANEFMGKLQESSDLSDEKETAAKVAEPIRNFVAILVQILSYIITICLALRVVLDLAYIALPFSRVLLGNGFTGSAQNASQPPMMNAGGPGAGGNFFNSGYNSSLGYSAGRALGQQVGASGQVGMANQVNANNNVQLVSSAALNAVASEGALGGDGKPMNAYKLYAKDMLVILVLTPVFLVLAVTGTLTDLGFLIGDALTGVIATIGGLI